MEVSTNTINIDYNNDYIIFNESNNYTIDASYIDTSYIDTVTTINTTGTLTFTTSTFTPTTIATQGNGSVYLDSTVDFNGWTLQPGFLVDLGNSDEVHYTHKEATEALKEHYIEKKLREEHKMLEKAYKEYKMLARLLQIDIEEEE